MYGSRHTDEKIATHSFFQGAQLTPSREPALRRLILGENKCRNKHVGNNKRRRRPKKAIAVKVLGEKVREEGSLS